MTNYIVTLIWRDKPSERATFQALDQLQNYVDYKKPHYARTQSKFTKVRRRKAERLMIDRDDFSY